MIWRRFGASRQLVAPARRINPTSPSVRDFSIEIASGVSEAWSLYEQRANIESRAESGKDVTQNQDSAVYFYCKGLTKREVDVSIGEPCISVNG